MQSRRSSSPLASGSPDVFGITSGVEGARKQPLVEPTMLHGAGLHRDDDDDDAPDVAQVAKADGAAAPGASPPPSLGLDMPAPVKARAAKKAPAKRAKAPEPWVEPADSLCPDSHPLKAKLSSGIFHLPGMLAYDRTNPDRCYSDEQAAEGDGLRRAKR